MFRQATNIFNLEENVTAMDKSHLFYHVSLKMWERKEREDGHTLHHHRAQLGAIQHEEAPGWSITLNVHHYFYPLADEIWNILAWRTIGI